MVKEKEEKAKKTEKEQSTKEKKLNQQTTKKTDSKKAPKKTKKPKTEEKLEELGKKLEEINDKYLRLSAEFDNYRKRTLKEKSELIKTAGESILINLLPVIDDFDRAMQSITEAKDVDALKSGMELIYNKFKEFLTQNGVNEIEAMHKDFDTDLHEAVTNIPAPSEELKDKIVDVIQKGYLLNDKVIRYSKAVVGE